MSTCQAFFWKSLSWTRFRHRRVRSVGVFSSEGVFSVLAWFSVYRCLWAPGQSVRRCGLYVVVCIPENSILILAKQSSKVAEAGARRPSLVPEILSLWFPLLSCSRRRRWSLRRPRAVTIWLINIWRTSDKNIYYTLYFHNPADYLSLWDTKSSDLACKVQQAGFASW
jgi:hypothetical protein